MVVGIVAEGGRGCFMYFKLGEIEDVVALVDWRRGFQDALVISDGLRSVEMG